MTAIRSQDSSEDEFGNLTGYRLGSRRALLDILLEAKTDGRKVGLDDKDIQEEIDTFMFEVYPILSFYLILNSHSLL